MVLKTLLLTCKTRQTLLFIVNRPHENQFFPHIKMQKYIYFNVEAKTIWKLFCVVKCTCLCVAECAQEMLNLWSLNIEIEKKSQRLMARKNWNTPHNVLCIWVHKHALREKRLCWCCHISVCSSNQQSWCIRCTKRKIPIVFCSCTVNGNKQIFSFLCSHACLCVRTHFLCVPLC